MADLAGELTMDIPCLKAALATYFPGEQPDYVSLESSIVAKILIEAVRRANTIPGVTIDGDRLADALGDRRAGFRARQGAEARPKRAPRPPSSRGSNATLSFL